MRLKQYLVVSILPMLFILAMGCSLLEDISKTDFEKDLSNLTKEWIVDSARVRKYDYIQSTSALPQTPLLSDTSLPIKKMEFLHIGDATGGTLRQTSVENDVEVVSEIEWRYDGEYLRLYFPNPATPGLSPQATIFDVEELTDKNFHFKRDENLVDDRSGVRYGSLVRTFKMHK